MRLLWVLSVLSILSIALALWAVIYLVAVWVMTWVR